MNTNYAKNAGLFKALADKNRLMIVDMLSCGELCACMILEKFNITQPTLSHHMKILCDCGLVNGRKEGKWTYYSLNNETVQYIRVFWDEVTSMKDDYICYVAAVEEGCCE
ncbi:MAG: metalloregulator ArsR/SmtB family transcription factor [Symbiobacteriaceae bacterium]|nr:metalloregulator ArsR/SmtB family transcription factor [Symbiobacteriaceae bacterium]